MSIDTIAQSPSKTLGLTLASFCFGILVGPLLLFVRWEMLLVISIALLALLFFQWSKRHRLILLVLFALFIGVFRYAQSEVPTNITTVADSAGVSVQISGTIDAEVERRVGVQQIVLDDVSVAGASSHGKVLVRAPLYPEVFYGNEIQFNCRLEQPEPFNGFAYDRFLKSRGVLAVCAFPQYIDVIGHDQSFIGMILSFKHHLVHRIRAVVPEPHASFVSGLVFGGSSSLSKDLKDDFARTGTSHILAASGFNVSLFSLVLLGWLLRSPLGRKRSLSIAAVLLAVYVVLAGATPAVVRAVIMGALVLASQWVQRKPYNVNLILLTASMMLLANPRILLDDVGFQLSFAATIALITLPAKWEKSFSFIPNTVGVRESFVASLAAITVTLPIVLWHFGAVSIIAPIVNLFVLPLIPFLMALVFVMLGLNIVSGFIASIIGLGVWALSLVMLMIIHWFSAIDVALINVTFSQSLVVFSVIVMILIWYATKSKA